MADEKKARRLSNDEINKIAKDLAGTLVYYDLDLWELNTETGIWENLTGHVSKDREFALRLIVKNNLPSDVDVKQIDDVKRELKTLIQEKMFKFGDLKPGIQFTDKRIYFNGERSVIEDKVFFTPFQVKNNFPKNKVEAKDAPNFKKFADNFTGKDEKRYAAIMEFMGYCLAGEHSGVALFLDGESSIGKTTWAKLVDKAISGKIESEQIHSLNSNDIFTGDGDAYAFANGVMKSVWTIGEGGKVITEDAVKRFNDLIDETNPVFNVRRMGVAPYAAPKFFNLIVQINGSPQIHASNEQTLGAVKKRILPIISPAKGPALDLENWYKLFEGDDLKFFIQEAIRHYIKSKARKKARLDKFTIPEDIEHFWNRHEEDTQMYMIMEQLQVKMTLKDTNVYKDFGYIAELFFAKKLDFVANYQITEILKWARDNRLLNNVRYNNNAFKNELAIYVKNLGGSSNLESIIKMSGKSQRGIALYWKEENYEDNN